MKRFFGIAECLLVLGVIFLVGIGCKLSELTGKNEAPTIAEAPATTVITKANLRQRLNARLVVNAVKLPPGKPNPLTLQLKFAGSNKDFLLNQEHYDNFGALVNTLKKILEDREYNGLFEEGTNDIYQIITLPAFQSTIDDYNSKKIYVEDLEKLVDDLRIAGFQRLELDTNEENQAPAIRQLPTRFNTRGGSESSSSNDQSKRKDVPKTISGGVLNGKAIDLAKPAYPAAARAVRASGSVNVQVTVDEKGDVISANAVSGHPLLRSAAVNAARNAKFSPTLLSGQAVQVTGVIVYNFKPE